MIATAFLAKGLDLDRGVAPFCSEKQYNAGIDRHMLYAGCTRAMHRLALTYSRKPSPFLAPAIELSAVCRQPAPSI